MPRLIDPKVLKGQAVAALVNLYRCDKEFALELDKIRDPYLDLIIELAMVIYESGKRVQPWTEDDWRSKIESSSIESTKEIRNKLKPYFEDLTNLAYKWKLRAPWAITMLMLYDISDVLRIKGLMPSEIEIPLELYESLYAWGAPLPSLEIKVPAWALVFEGREKIIAMIRKKLSNYENELKAVGLKEYPSSIQNHAKWWFKHYVHGKKYDDIAQDEVRSMGDSYIIYARNVGRAVRAFSRLIGINPLDLKK